MKSFINFEAKIFCWITSILCSVVLLSVAFSLLSEPDDLSVIGATLMLFAIAAFWSYVIRTRIQKRIATNSKEEKK